MTDYDPTPVHAPVKEISLTPTGDRSDYLGPKAGLSRRGMTGGGDWAQRISRHILPDGSVAVPPRIAAWLEKRAGVTDDRRIALRDTDPAAYTVLAALRLAALYHCSGTGTQLAEQQHITEELAVWMSTSTAAELLGITDRAIRKRIAAGKLPATRHGSRWLINRNELQALALSA
jgi:excisionase family DNA binding protein